MDREMTSLMGLPQSVYDADVNAEFPVFAGSNQRLSALRMQVKLSQAIAKINRGTPVLRTVLSKLWWYR
jgi:proline utilization trans-activator